MNALFGASFSLEDSHMARVMLLYFKPKTCIQTVHSNIKIIFITYLLTYFNSFAHLLHQLLSFLILIPMAAWNIDMRGER